MSSLRKLNYTDSGLSSVQAVADARARTATSLSERGVPRVLARLIMRSFTMSLSCDGIDCASVGHTNSKLDANGHWAKSGGWVHREDLDFCRACQFDGSMYASIKQGVRPRGSN